MVRRLVVGLRLQPGPRWQEKYPCDETRTLHATLIINEGFYLPFDALRRQMILLSLMIGVLEYRFTEGMGWLEAFLNASMILGGMGPVNTLHTDAGKLFASFYALFAGSIFLIAIGVFVTPIIHRLLHQFHADPEALDVQGKSGGA